MEEKSDLGSITKTILAFPFDRSYSFQDKDILQKTPEGTFGSAYLGYVPSRYWPSIIHPIMSPLFLCFAEDDARIAARNFKAGVSKVQFQLYRNRPSKNKEIIVTLDGLWNVLSIIGSQETDAGYAQKGEWHASLKLRGHKDGSEIILPAFAYSDMVAMRFTDTAYFKMTKPIEFNVFLIR